MKQTSLLSLVASLLLVPAVIAADAKVDEIEHEVHSFTVRLLALRQPVAHDLRMIVGALNSRDYVTLQGLTLVYCFIVIAVNLATDILYGIADPRVKVA